ncbi:MAG: hypothetical protein EA396_09920 [Anaerolineaceae bacterium]|nr:MAG: hypothetical protein EA396_09920 [Anaerolineaceae bacterium]
MKLHLVGGFLGSGKTTAIAGAARALIASGLRVGVVTNDQGKYLVDTLFMNHLQIPTVEVGGGCFCCHYDDLDDRLHQLQATGQPDVIFAESVGSCADIVATVIKPLLSLSHPPTSFSVFADARLLRQRLLDRPLPFSEDVVYIFDQQIEEAGMLVINKVDLLSPDDAQDTAERARQRYPEKRIRLQNTLNDDDIAAWLDDIQGDDPPLSQATLDIDYDRYGAGEAALAWLDQSVRITLPDEAALRPALISLIERIAAPLEREVVAIGHLKFLIDDGTTPTKISLTTLKQGDWQDGIPTTFTGDTATLAINCRAQINAETLHEWVAAAVAHTREEYAGGVFEVSDSAHFHPAYPRPTHRMI